jgi:hypothetical protein
MSSPEPLLSVIVKKARTEISGKSGWYREENPLVPGIKGLGMRG